MRHALEARASTATELGAAAVPAATPAPVALAAQSRPLLFAALPTLAHRLAPFGALVAAVAVGCSAGPQASGAHSGHGRSNGTTGGMEVAPTGVLGGMTEPPTAPSATSQEVTSDAELPEVRTLADVEQHAGHRVRVLGRYEVTPVPGSKRLQPACIVLADGERLIRSYRPVPEELHFDGQRVVAIGKALLSAGAGGNVQQVMAPHVFVETLSLDPIESPYAPGMTEVRTPPTLTSAAEVPAHLDRWVQIFGKLERLVDKPNEDYWVDMRVQLADGSTLEATSIARGRVEKLVGKDVSFIAMVAREQPPGGPPRVDPTHIVCEGRVERCGMGGPVAPRR